MSENAPPSSEPGGSPEGKKPVNPLSGPIWVVIGLMAATGLAAFGFSFAMPEEAAETADLLRYLSGACIILAIILYLTKRTLERRLLG